MSEPKLVDVEHNVSMSFYLYRYSDGSVQVRKPEGNEVARQHGIHTINLTKAEVGALARILARPAKLPVSGVMANMRHPELYVGEKNPGTKAGEVY